MTAMAALLQRHTKGGVAVCWTGRREPRCSGIEQCADRGKRRTSSVTGNPTAFFPRRARCGECLPC